MTALVVNRFGDAMPLRDQYAGASVVLCCGGPSLAEMDLSPLQQRGVMVAAVNQVAATHVRPQFWFSVDEPARFAEPIWTDPGILKFVPIGWATVGTARWNGTAYESTGRMANSYPSTLFFRNTKDGWRAEDFFETPKVVWGGSVSVNGQPREVKSVLFAALRLLDWLGFRRIILLGADFYMTPQRTYAFPDPKNQHASQTNNNTYAFLNHWLGLLRTVAAARGLVIQNATPGSRLEAFERVEFHEALASITIPPAAHVAGHYQVKGDRR